MAEQKFLDNLVGVPALWNAIKGKFVAKEDGKGLSANDFTNALKSKLDAIEAGAEVNQNAFSTVSVGTGESAVSVAAGAKTDTVNVVAGDNVTLTADASAKKITIAAKDTTYTDATESTSGLMSAADKKIVDGVTAKIDKKQDNLTAEQLAAVNSGVTADKVSKLDGIATGAQVNVIETVKVNGKALTPDESKAVDVTVPTDNKDLINGAGYQTANDVDQAIKAAAVSTMEYKGSVDTAAQLPSEGQKTGDTYNIVAASQYGDAGMNVAWNGTGWDALGSSFIVTAMTAEEVTALCV